MLDDQGHVAGSPAEASVRALLGYVQKFRGPLALPSLAEFSDMVARTPSTAPGPDGFCYGCWGAHLGNVQSLYRCLEALWGGVAPASWFNAVVVVFIPKAVLSAGECEHRASAAQYRPLMLANSCQKFVAKVLNRLLEVVAAETVSPLQWGFVRGRSLVDNVLDIVASTSEYLYDIDGDPGVFLFDVAAAFPPASQAWICRVLEAMELPLALRRGMQLLYLGSTWRAFVAYRAGAERDQAGLPVERIARGALIRPCRAAFGRCDGWFAPHRRVLRRRSRRSGSEGVGGASLADARLCCGASCDAPLCERPQNRAGLLWRALPGRRRRGDGHAGRRRAHDGCALGRLLGRSTWVGC